MLYDRRFAEAAAMVKSLHEGRERECADPDYLFSSGGRMWRNRAKIQRS